MKNMLLLCFLIIHGGIFAAYANECNEENPSEFSAALCPAPVFNNADLSIGQELANFFPGLLDTQSWPARWNCGNWSPFLGWLYIASDVLIWVAYFAIPVILFFFVYRRGSEVPFRAIFLWFIGFILACGLTHLTDAALFWWPAYRLSALVRFVTAFVSLGTVFALTKVIPQALQLQSPETLEKIVEQRTVELRRANEEIIRLNKSLADFQWAVNISSIISKADRGGTITFVNDNFVQISGYSQHELIGQNHNIINSDYHEKAFWTEMWKTISAGHVWRKVVKNKAKDGSFYWVDTFIIPFLNEVGKIQEFLSIRNDITPQKQAEIALQQSEQRLRQVVDNLAEGLILSDDTGQFLHWNRAAIALHGFASREECYDKLPEFQQSFELSSLDGTVLPLEKWPLSRLLQQHPLSDMEVAVRHLQQGWTRIFCYGGGSITESDGNRLYFLTINEITKRKKAEKDLQESESRLQQLTESLPQLVWTCQPDGPCDYLSKQWVSYTGIPEEEQLGFKWLDQIHPEDRDTTIQKWTQAVETNTDFRVEFRIRDHQGNYRWFDTIATRLYDADEQLVKWFGTNTDIEEKKKRTLEIHRLNSELEDRVQKRTAQLELANRELEAFSYSVSHDLRAPLRHIQGYSDILVEEYQDQLDEEGGGMLFKIKRRAVKMGELIDDLLEFSKMGRRGMSKELINVYQLIAELSQDLLALEEGRNIAFTVHPLDNVAGDYSMIKQVWSNLLSNAIKYTRSTENPRIEIGSSQQDGKVMCYIKDNGVGFDMKHVDQVFQVFQRLHREKDFEGTGVGLALVQRIIQRHGGTIWVEAQENQGATFYFTLPVHEGTRS